MLEHAGQQALDIVADREFFVTRPKRLSYRPGVGELVKRGF